MRRKNNGETVTEVVQPVDVSVYAMSKGADRLRALETEMVAAFEEWAGAQKALADDSLLAEFKMSGPLLAAWMTWRAEKYGAAGGANGEETSIIEAPVGWPQQ